MAFSLDRDRHHCEVLRKTRHCPRVPCQWIVRQLQQSGSVMVDAFHLRTVRLTSPVDRNEPQVPNIDYTVLIGCSKTFAYEPQMSLTSSRKSAVSDCKRSAIPRIRQPYLRERRRSSSCIGCYHELQATERWKRLSVDRRLVGGDLNGSVRREVGRYGKGDVCEVQCEAVTCRLGPGSLAGDAEGECEESGN